MDHETLLENEIRLIDFDTQPGKSAVIRAPLGNEITNYVALSYCWGTDNCLHRYILNGQTLIVTSALLVIFEDLQQRGFKGKLWADAVCINQNDDDEKAIQIGLMGQIYQSADKVFAWLDVPGGIEHDLTADTLVDLAEKIGDDKSLGETPFEDTIGDLGLPPIEANVWIALVGLFDNAWHFRAWTLQEAVLAKRLIVYYGILECTFHQVVRLARNLWTANFIWSTPASKMRGSNGPEMTERVMKLYAAGQLSNAIQLQFSQERSSTKECDKVLSLYSLGNLREVVPLNLSASPELLFIYAAKAVMQLDEHPLNLLSLVEGESRMSRLPSWVPDLRTPGRAVLLTTLIRDFAAGMPRSRNPPPVISLDNGDNTLAVQGFVLDRVCEVVDKELHIQINKVSGDDLLKQGKDVIDWLSVATKLAEATLPVPKVDARKALYRTLMADSPDHREPGQRSYKEIADDFTFLIDHYRTCAEGRNDWSLYRAWFLIQDVAATVKGRRLFSTESGRIGIGPASVQPGDFILILYDDMVPEIARQRPDGDTFEFLGQAYVDGIMYGEAMREHEARNEAPILIVFD